MQILVGFYREQASVEFEGFNYTPQALIDAEKQLLSGKYSGEQ